MTSNQHAIVLGASMSGLMAARVLSDHFEQVTVIERDQLPATIQQRKGIPHGNHAHGLLRGGRLALERLFPGVVDELTAQGAIDCDMANDVHFFNEGEPLARFASDLRTLLLSRPLLEGHLRARVQQLPNVVIRDGLEAVELVASQGVVCGVRAKPRGAAELTDSLTADLVVDASGRGSRMAGWLQTLGFEPATEERVHTEIRYASCTYRRRPTVSSTQMVRCGSSCSASAARSSIRPGRSPSVQTSLSRKSRASAQPSAS